MKKLVVIVLLVIFCSPASTQVNFQEMKQCLALENISNDSIGVDTSIRSVSADISYNNREKIFNKADTGAGQLEEVSPGFEGNVTLGYQLGVGDYGLSRLKLNLSAGYRVDPHISLGVGIGARQYPDLKATLLPVYADFRGWLLTSKVSPFFSFQVGTMFHASEEFKNVGIFVSPNLGVSSRFSDGTSMHFTIGYEYQRMGFYKQGGGYIYESNENCGAVSFNVGVAF